MPNPRCPICGASLDFAKAWNIRDQLGWRAIYVKPGILCPRCGAQLILVQWRTALVNLVSYIVYVALLIYFVPHDFVILKRLPHWEGMAIALIVVGPLIAFQMLVAP